VDQCHVRSERRTDGLGGVCGRWRQATLASLQVVRSSCSQWNETADSNMEPRRQAQIANFGDGRTGFRATATTPCTKGNKRL
jgi:hypothetical protein